MAEWYVDAQREPIDFDTVLDEDGLMTVDVWRLVQGADGSLLRYGWKRAGAKPLPAEFARAKRMASSDPVPADRVPPAGPAPSGGGNLIEFAPDGNGDYWESTGAIALEGGNDTLITDFLAFTGDDGLFVPLDEPFNDGFNDYRWEATRTALINWEVNVSGPSQQYRVRITLNSSRHDTEQSTPSLYPRVNGEVGSTIYTGLVRKGDMVSFTLSDGESAGQDVSYVGVFLYPQFAVEEPATTTPPPEPPSGVWLSTDTFDGTYAGTTIPVSVIDETTGISLDKNWSMDWGEADFIRPFVDGDDASLGSVGDMLIVEPGLYALIAQARFASGDNIAGRSLTFQMGTRQWSSYCPSACWGGGGSNYFEASGLIRVTEPDRLVLNTQPWAPNSALRSALTPNRLVVEMRRLSS